VGDHATSREEQLEQLEFSVALGSLLNAIAHDMNNRLTNLILAGENARQSGQDQAFDILAEQARKATEITAAVQRLGSGNLGNRSSTADLNAVAQQLASWQGLGRPSDVTVEVLSDSAPRVQATPDILMLAFALLLRLVPVGEDRRIQVGVSTESVPRSRWSQETEEVDMAVVRLSGSMAPAEQWPPVDFARVVDAFFEGERTPSEVRVMGAWEILRKVAGRPSARLSLPPGSDDRPPEVVVWLPLALD